MKAEPNLAWIDVIREPDEPDDAPAPVAEALPSQAPPADFVRAIDRRFADGCTGALCAESVHGSSVIRLYERTGSPTGGRLALFLAGRLASLIDLSGRDLRAVVPALVGMLGRLDAAPDLPAPPSRAWRYPSGVHPLLILLRGDGRAEDANALHRAAREGGAPLLAALEELSRGDCSGRVRAAVERVIVQVPRGAT